MPTNQQRREAERRRLQQQLEERRAREAARKRTTLIASIVGTIVVIAVVIVVVAVSVSGGSGKKHGAGSQPSGSPSTTPSSPTSATSSAPAPVPTTACAKPQGAKAHFAGLTVTGAADVKHAPKLTGKSSATPAALECADLVAGKGAAAKQGQSVTVQYVGALLSTGKVFQSSWGTQPATFTLKTGQGGVITGFFQGIAGAGKVAPMHVGGRRLIILPSSIAYGATAQQGIPANSSLVFIVDLQKAA